MYRPTPFFAFFLKTAATALAMAVLGALFLRAADHDERSQETKRAAQLLRESMNQIR